MKTDVVTLSSKYQLVIPKSARQKLGLNKPEGQLFTVKSVTEDEVVFRKDKSLDDYLGKYGKDFPVKAATKLRQMRDSEWE
jgi:bifunctional DNA-binding transcriptional regulator/antitoxin component of YhaV-PrlF toxin-antitoxin module